MMQMSTTYLVGKHIPLFLVAVNVFVFLFLPCTLSLLFGQWLQAISHLRLFSWVNSARLKPFMDAYHAPYKVKHRYWPGLLLMLRCVLLLLFALNPQQDSNINLLAILVQSHGGWDSSTLGLGQWWSLQELVSECTGRLIFIELDHASWYNLLCQILKRKSACSGLHFSFYSICNIHCDPCLPHLPSVEAHQPPEEDA